MQSSSILFSPSQGLESSRLCGILEAESHILVEMTVVVCPVNPNEAMQLKMQFISLNFSHINTRHLVYNNCVVSFPLHRERMAHLKVMSVDVVLCCWLVARQAAQSL